MLLEAFFNNKDSCDFFVYKILPAFSGGGFYLPIIYTTVVVGALISV